MDLNKDWSKQVRLYKNLAFPGGILWLGSLDSNQERMIQSHLCYHYTTSQHVEILRGYYTIKKEYH